MQSRVSCNIWWGMYQTYVKDSSNRRMEYFLKSWGTMAIRINLNLRSCYVDVLTVVLCSPGGGSDRLEWVDTTRWTRLKTGTCRNEQEFCIWKSKKVVFNWIVFCMFTYCQQEKKDKMYKKLFKGGAWGEDCISSATIQPSSSSRLIVQ